jgi:hypothetical protein
MTYHQSMGKRLQEILDSGRAGRLTTALTHVGLKPLIAA